MKDGTEVYYVAGNHDEFLREFIRDFPLLEFGSVHIGDEFIHETADGQKLLVIHGDRFDLVTKYAKCGKVKSRVGPSRLHLRNLFR